MTTNNRTLLPVSTDPTDGCNAVDENAKGRYCFESGDSRANENLFLTTMHLIWARHHNYIASELEKLNPHWNDERIFQEAKRIVTAQLQHITYNEFLPVILGKRFIRILHRFLFQLFDEKKILSCQVNLTVIESE